MLTPNVKAKAGKSAPAPDFRICPACQTRNKSKWEFCARCGESLQDVPLGDPGGVGAAAAEPIDLDPDPFPLGAILGWGIALAIAAAVWVNFRKPAGPQPSKEIFTIATLPPSAFPPVPPASPSDASEAERLYQEGRQLLAHNNAVAALPLLSQAVALAGGNGAYHNAYAHALWETGSRDQALAEFEAASRADPSVVHWRDLGSAREAAGRPTDAVMAYDAALANGRDDYDTARRLGNLQLNLKHYEAAAAALRRAARSRPDDPAVQQALAQALEQTGNLDAARSAYEAVLKKEPAADLTRGQLAELLMQQGNPEAAADVFRDRIQRDPGAPLLHRGLGSVLERSGHPVDAAQEYRRYSQLAPNAPDAKNLQERADALVAQAQQQAPVAQ